MIDSDVKSNLIFDPDKDFKTFMIRTLPAAPWLPDQPSIFSLLASDPSWDIPPGTRIKDHYNQDAVPLSEQEIATHILSYCRSESASHQLTARNNLIGKLGERNWDRQEHERVNTACDWAAKEELRWCEFLLILAQTAPDFTVVYNSLEQLRVCNADVPAGILDVMSRNKRLAYPSFDILLHQSSIPTETRNALYSQMAERLSGSRKLLTLRLLGEAVSPALAYHVLATPIQNVGQIGYPLSENIDQYMEFLSHGRLLETLSAGYPGVEIIRNLTNTYAEISKLIFWDEDYDEVLEAYPLFVNYLAQTPLGLEDLLNLHDIYKEMVDDNTDGVPAQNCELQSAREIFEGIFRSDKYRKAILHVLENVASPYYTYVIDMAVRFYGADEFELRFTHAQHAPIEGFTHTAWLYRMSDGQRHRFLEWVRRALPAGLLERPLQRDVAYSKVQARLLEEVIDRAEHTLVDPKDRQDFLIWGLSSTDTGLASNAAWLLEDLPVPDWPEGVAPVLHDLVERTKHKRTSWKSGENKYVKAKDRLASLARLASL